MTSAPPTPRPDLDERYGRTATRARWNRRATWIAAGSFAVVFAAWVVWGGLDGSADTIQTQDTAHQVLDERTVSVTWQITMQPGDAASCALEAQNEAHAIVGWKVVEVEPSTVRTRAFTELVTTTEQAVTGLIYRCWPA